MILDLTLERILLARHSILKRHTAQHRRQVRIAEEVTRTLAMNVQGAAGNKPGMSAAQKIRFLTDDPEPAAPAAAPPPPRTTEPGMNSFERAISRFGRPMFDFTEGVPTDGR